jgi:hypothetical protein
MGGMGMGTMGMPPSSMGGGGPSSIVPRSAIPRPAIIHRRPTIPHHPHESTLPGGAPRGLPSPAVPPLPRLSSLPANPARPDAALPQSDLPRPSPAPSHHCPIAQRHPDPWRMAPRPPARTRRRGEGLSSSSHRKRRQGTHPSRRISGRPQISWCHILRIPSLEENLPPGQDMAITGLAQERGTLAGT